MNDFCHMFDGDGFGSLCFQFIKELRDALFYVIGDFFAALACAEIIAERLLVGRKHLVGILIDGKEASAKVDGNILFHCCVRSLGFED